MVSWINRKLKDRCIGRGGKEGLVYQDKIKSTIIVLIFKGD